MHVWNKKAYAFCESIKEYIRGFEYPIEKSRRAIRTNTMQISADKK